MMSIDRTVDSAVWSDKIALFVTTDDSDESGSLDGKDGVSVKNDVGNSVDDKSDIGVGSSNRACLFVLDCHYRCSSCCQRACYCQRERPLQLPVTTCRCIRCIGGCDVGFA